MPDANKRKLNGILQGFEGACPYDLVGRFCLVGHWLLGKRIETLMLARSSLINDVQFQQTWDENLARSSFAKLLGNHPVDRIKRRRGLIFIESAFFSQCGHELDLLILLVDISFLLSHKMWNTRLRQQRQGPDAGTEGGRRCHTPAVEIYEDAHGDNEKDQVPEDITK